MSEYLHTLESWHRNDDSGWQARSVLMAKPKTRNCLNAYEVKKWGTTPKWADKERMKVVYQRASKLGMEVDHIVPFISSLVCGLHVWENLQLLHPEENRKKRNTRWPDMPEAV